ncbi:unnamed protein product, partial [Closterium sp. NIES-54]
MCCFPLPLPPFHCPPSVSSFLPHPFPIPSPPLLSRPHSPTPSPFLPIPHSPSSVSSPPPHPPFPIFRFLSASPSPLPHSPSHPPSPFPFPIPFPISPSPSPTLSPLPVPPSPDVRALEEQLWHPTAACHVSSLAQLRGVPRVAASVARAKTIHGKLRALDAALHALLGDSWRSGIGRAGRGGSRRGRGAGGAVGMGGDGEGGVECGGAGWGAVTDGGLRRSIARLLEEALQQMDPQKTVNQWLQEKLAPHTGSTNSSSMSAEEAEEALRGPVLAPCSSRPPLADVSNSSAATAGEEGQAEPLLQLQ